MTSRGLVVLGLFLTVTLTALWRPFAAPTDLPATKPAKPAGEEERPFGLKERVPWTTSHVRGRPEPPPPWRARKRFPKLGFERPTVLTGAPGTRRLFVAEHSGTVYSVPDDRDCEQADVFLDVRDLVEQMNAGLEESEQVRLVAVYGLTFHPNFAENRYCYVCYVVRYRAGGRGQHPHGTRVVRLKVSEDDPPRCDVESEQTVITWLQGGHNGGCLKFGPDGCLYVSTGDGGFAFPPDGRNSGQDVSNLLSAILRIDVDTAGEGQGYRIPPDNPFVDLEDARGEIWAYGLRNPWKMSFDRKTGDLWVGDVGWELWELVYRVRKGDNFGWSLVEGRQPVHTERQRGPTPIVPPTVEIPHTDGASVTGGFVYRGEKFPELVGTYVFGDWETRRIWGVSADADEPGPMRELVEPTVRIVGFAEDADGELLLLDYDDGGIYELQRNEVDPNAKPFPRKLSETGLFTDVASHEVAPGVVPFSVNVEQWADHATAERFLAIPGTGSVRFSEKPREVPGSMFRRSIAFPQHTVLMKTVSLETTHGDPATRRRIETQLLHFDGRDWWGYTYAWNDDQNDAVLVGRDGRNVVFDVADADAPGGHRKQRWRFPSRTECIRCHNPWAEFTLAFNVPQLNRDHDFGGVVDNQIRAFRHVGILQDAPPEIATPFDHQFPPKTADQLPRLADPSDETADLDLRGRSYLHVNCAHCHRNGGGGAAHIHIPFDTPLVETEAVGMRPTQGTFGIHDAEIIAPGDPYRSVLYFRMAKTGPGHMPRLGAGLVDRRGVKLIHDWIASLPARPKLAANIDRLAELDEAAILEREARHAPRDRWRLAVKIARRNDRETPTDADHETAKREFQAAAEARVKQRAEERQRLLEELLATPDAASLLAKAIREDRLPESIETAAVEAGFGHSDIATRDLFESFVPPERRIERLGESVEPEQILGLKGDVRRGRELFRTSQAVQCRNCHRIGKVGKQLGPDLSHVGKKNDRAKLLESILEPSRKVDPKYVTWLVETKRGRVFTGLLAERTDEAIVLRDTQNETHRFATSDVEGLFPQRKSMMPELLVRDLTAQQLADLLAYLASLK